EVGFRYVTETDIWGVISRMHFSGEGSLSAARASAKTRGLLITYVGCRSKALVRDTDFSSTDLNPAPFIVISRCLTEIPVFLGANVQGQDRTICRTSWRIASYCWAGPTIR